MNADYNGFVPDGPIIIQNGSQSPVHQLADDILEKNLQSRVYIMEHLIKDPGFVATLDEFEVVFDDIKLETDTETLRDLNETRIVVTQSVRIRRKVHDGSGVPLGGNSRGEARTN